MFLRYLDPLFAPFRKARANVVKARNVKGNFKVDVKRAKAMGGMVGGHVKNAKGKVAGVQMPKVPQGQAAANPTPGVKKVGLFGRKHVCEQCGQQLDKSWDSCPYCAQSAGAANNKTQAFMIDPAGTGSHQMLAWLVPIKGPQRGELHTLAPVSLIGTDATATVCLVDQYMSTRHAEIKAEGGVWVLRDLGSTNGTYVNDRRIEQHELVDNDFVKFGQSLTKFKSL